MSAKELRELLSRLSDGTLSTQDVDRLNALLKTDRIAQEEYLDHMLVDGLLEREFAAAGLPFEKKQMVVGPDSSRAAPRRLMFPFLTVPRLLALAATILVVIGWGIWMSPSGRHFDRSLALNDSGFERELSHHTGDLSKGTWCGDPADVVGNFSDVTPQEGSRMLRFVKSTREPEDACELYQIVDLKDVSGELASCPMSVEASAAFNSIPEDLREGDFSFGVTVFAFSEDPSTRSDLGPMRWENALTFSGSQTRADGDSKSWQRVATQLPLPADTKYLVVQLAVIRTDTDEEEDEFPGQFADNVALKLMCEK